LQLYVQDAINENFTLALGPASESITVRSDNFGVRTDSVAVSTVVDDQFVQNMPLNGRSFQSLIALAPGTVFVSGIEGDGQFSVNGQRSDANYITVDGVNANFGSTAGCCLGQSIGGATPRFQYDRLDWLLCASGTLCVLRHLLVAGRVTKCRVCGAYRGRGKYPERNFHETRATVKTDSELRHDF